MEEKRGMMKIEERKAPEEEPQLIIGLIPALNRFFIDSAWNMIRSHVDNLAGESMGEYTGSEVWNAVYFGGAWLYLAYFDKPLARDGQAHIAFKVSSPPEEAKKGLVGYFILRPDPKGAFIWQAYIDPSHAKTNIMEKGIEFIASEAKKIGATKLSFSTMRPGWGRVAPHLGFKEGFTTYIMDLKKE